ncbi:MAG: NrfD/PsrC family molybdoenzyme membrane anchor subunit [Bacteroidota bacterium]|jgi:Ni/Fe-hydrogenase subunit HybB-like protein
MVETQRPKFAITPWMIWLGLMGIILLGGLVAGILVFWKGLGITNLTDKVPWGLWITIDLSSIALGAGAFSMCAAVYLFGLKRFQPIARTATFIGLIGYTMATLALILDIGRPERFWHSLVYWNPHSLLWEVTMCVVLYLTVLVFESMPIVANWDWLRKHMPKVAKMMSGVHHYAPILAIIGLGLSSLHQSSLGATYGVIKARPFWFKPEMAVLFMFSAIVGGIALTLFATMLASRLTRKAKINDGLIERVALFVGYLLIGYFYFRIWDVLAQTYVYYPGRTEGLLYLTKGPFAFNFWVMEIFLGMLVPMILLLYKPTRVNRFWRMVALLLIATGVIAFRWNTNITGQLVLVPYITGLPITYTSYRPSLIEIMAGTAIIAYGLTAFSLGVKYFRVVDHTLVEEEHEKVQVKSTEPVRL